MSVEDRRPLPLEPKCNVGLIYTAFFMETEHWIACRVSFLS
jgi:hypothetical protein